MKKCFKCGTTINVVDKIGFKDECDNCTEDLHVCLNCQFYDENYYNECRETQAEYVKDKERANFCEYFVFKDSNKNFKKEDLVEDSKKKFNDLFKD